jgi:hypothetical protein
MGRIELKIFGGLFLISVLLAAAHVIFVWPDYGTYPQDLVYFFHLDREGNLPSWFASAQFMALAAIIWAISVLQPAQRLMWRLCAAGALFLSFDEGAQFHEKVGNFIEREVAAPAPHSIGGAVKEFGSYYWLLVYAPLALPVLAVLFWFVRREMGRRVYWLAFAAALYLGGAVVLEYLEGRYGSPEHMGITVRQPDGKLLLIDTVLPEEFLEMTGASIAIALFAGHLAALWKRR